MRDILAGEDTGRIAMLIKGHEVKDARYLEDGTIEVKMTISLDAVVRILEEVKS